MTSKTLKMSKQMVSNDTEESTHEWINTGG